MSPYLIAAVAAISLASPANAKEMFDDSKEVNAYESASAELVVPSSIIAKGRCQVEYRGKAYLDGPCTIALGKGGAIAVGSADFDSIEKLIAFVAVARDGTRTAVLNPITFKDLDEVWFGRVSQDGACWGNAIGRICAWRDK